MTSTEQRPPPHTHTHTHTHRHCPRLWQSPPQEKTDTQLTSSCGERGSGGGGDGVDRAGDAGSGAFTGCGLLNRAGITQVGAWQLSVETHGAEHALAQGQVVVTAKLTAVCNP